MDDEIKRSDRVLAQEHRRVIHTALAAHYAQQQRYTESELRDALTLLSDPEYTQTQEQADKQHLEVQRLLGKVALMVDRRIVHEQLARVTT